LCRARRNTWSTGSNCQAINAKPHCARLGPSMLKPLNRAEVEFDFLKEIGTDGRNSRTFLAKDHQLDADIVIKQIEKAKLASAANFFDESKALYAQRRANSLCMPGREPRLRGDAALSAWFGQGIDNRTAHDGPRNRKHRMSGAERAA
jgi:hypothetical protein